MLMDRPLPPPSPPDQQTAQLQRQMEQFFDLTNDAITFLDHGYNFTFLNRRARELISAGRDLLRTNLWEQFPNAAYEGSPFVENYRRSMEDKLPGEFDAFYPEPLNIWLHIQSYPTDEGIAVFFRDITEGRRKNETLLRKTEEAERQHAELETIYRTAPIALALFDLPDYHYVRLNDRQAAFFGLKPEQIVGKTLTQMAPIEGLQELFDQVARGEPVVDYPLEGTLVTDPENYRYWTVSYFPVYTADGSIQAITAASLEVTQQKKAEAALLQSEKLAAVGRLASSIAHEINNPLESVTNLLYLARTTEDPDEIQDFLAAAEIELRRVAAITSQTLRFHKQASSPQEISLTSLAESVLSIHQGRIVNTGVSIDHRWRARTPVRCFEGEIRQVLSNIIANALDAMHGGGRLLLRDREGTHWQSGQPGVFLTIADTGTGMNAATQASLFNAFFTTKGLTGTGLGLWVSQQIVERHRGFLRVRSSQAEQHHGTVFELFLSFDAVVRE